MAEIVFDGFACSDCACAIASGDTSGLDYYGDEYRAEWEAGVEKHAVPNSVIGCCGGDDEEGCSATDFVCDNCGRAVYSQQHKLVGFDR